MRRARLTAVSIDRVRRVKYVLGGMKSDPKVAVVVISHNTKDLLLECLASVIDSAAWDEIETVVVDNASSDGSYEAVRSAYPKVRAIRNPTNRGFGAACNQAIASTAAPFVLLLNSDARLTAEGFRALLDCMRTNERCGAAGCLVLGEEGASVVTTRNFLTALNQALEQAGVTGRIGSRYLRRTHIPVFDENSMDCTVDWIDGACLMLRRAALEQTGLFDERFFMYSEDEDLCFRLRKHGWSICHSAHGSAVHRGGSSTAQNRREMLRHFYYSQMLFLLKHRGRTSMLLYSVVMKTVLRCKRLVSTMRAGDRLSSDLTERLIALRRAQEAESRR
jgi:N-acetylglucosaminyl-diphospho-decaprenol L-rhamnosyltransferase